MPKISLASDDCRGREPASIIVMGANSQIGRFLLPRLLNADYTVHATTRSPLGEQLPLFGRISWHQVDYAAKQTIPLIGEAGMLIHLAPLPALPPIFDFCIRLGIKRIIALSSTSRFTKEKSPRRVEQDFVLQISAAEEQLARACTDSGIAWTLFRPTMTYGCGIDKNVSTIVALIRRFGFFPLAGAGKGLRQPVHADDLAAACVIALGNPATYHRAYNLSGGETLTYRVMVEKIFHALGKHPRFVNLPLPLMRGLIAMVSLLPRYRYVSGEMAQRMNTDLCFDHSEATHDFGYAPRKFEPDITF